MIVREVITNPELIDNFDWFNDYHDTHLYLREKNSDLLPKFEEGYKFWNECQRIKNMTQMEMCRQYRFAPSGSLCFDSSNPLSKIWAEEFEKKGGMTPEISKLIGW